MDDAIAITDDERRSGKLTPATLARAVRTFKDQGFVVLAGAVDPSVVAKVKDAYADALAQKVSRLGLARAEVLDAASRHQKVMIHFEPNGANHDVNRWNMHLPSRRPFFDPQIVANAAVLQVVHALVDDAVLFIVASDTPFPGSTFQNIHQDFNRYGLTVNIPLVPVTDENGPLEVWPRTHLPKPLEAGSAFTTANHWHRAAALDALVKAIPCTRVLVPVGSVIIRDQRLVHRGTHNASAEPRPALSLWYKQAARSVPHRRVVNLCQRLSLRARERARMNGAVNDPGALNRGNLAGRMVDEFANSDRDYRRRIPADVWAEIPEDGRRTLRFAEVESASAPPASALADLKVLATTAWLVK